jgi:hypothetical protein
MKKIIILEDDVFRLTSGFEKEVAGSKSSLSGFELQVLTLIDGETPAAQISTRASGIAHEVVVEILRKFRHNGLIEIVEGVGGTLDFVELFDSKFKETKPPDSRRKFKRFRAQWRIAIVLPNVSDNPVFHSLIEDISWTGIAVQSDVDVAKNTVLTLMLVPPVIDGSPPKMFKLKAAVVSSRPSKGQGFSLGMEFSENEELKALRKFLGKFDLSADNLPS